MSLPFNIPHKSEALHGSVYTNVQLLVQQVAYELSHSVFDYSTPEFDLSSALRTWSKNTSENNSKQTPEIIPLETRVGAANALFGYLSQGLTTHRLSSVLNTSKSLEYMLPTLKNYHQKVDLRNTVFHTASVDYQDGKIVTDYVSIQKALENLDFALISSISLEEAQDISLLATLMSAILPTVHTYDGIRALGESNKLKGTFSSGQISERARALSSQLSGLSNAGADIESQIVGLFKLFNKLTGSSYEPFEYYGHPNATKVFVSFGSPEATITTQLVANLSTKGHQVGALNVRLFKPFLVQEFLRNLPASTEQVIVVGASSSSEQSSPLVAAVSAALIFGMRANVSIVDHRYDTLKGLTPSELSAVIGIPKLSLLHESTKQYVFWDSDDSATAQTPVALSTTLAIDNTKNVNYLASYDNNVLGGIVQSEIRLSDTYINAPYTIESADLVFVNDPKILESYDVLSQAAQGSSVVIAGSLEDVSGKYLSENFKSLSLQKSLAVYSLDYRYLIDNASSTTDDRTVSMAQQIVFWKLAFPHFSADEITTKIVLANGVDTELVAATVVSLADAVFDKAFKEVKIESVPEDDKKEQNDEQKHVQFAAGHVARSSLYPSNRAAFTPEQLKTQTSSFADVTKALLFKEAYGASHELRPDLPVKNFIAKVKVNQRVTPEDYDRHIFHLELDITGTGLTYAIGEALGVHASNNVQHVNEFIEWYGLDPNQLVTVPARDSTTFTETKTVFHALRDNLDLFGKPPKRFYEELAQYATDEKEKAALLKITTPAGAVELKKRVEENFDSFADILQEFTSAHPPVEDLVQLISPSKRREYSIASSQKMHPNAVHLLIVVVDWVDAKGRKRYGHCSKYLSDLSIDSEVVVSVKPSVMKLPQLSTAPVIMAGLGTGLAPFKAFLEEKAWQKAQGQEIGEVYLFLGSRHQRQEYLYGEIFEAYRNAGILTYIGAAFSRDQPKKIYIQDKIKEAKDRLVDAFVTKKGSFYLCGPTWPVPDISAALADIVATEASTRGETIDAAREIETLKEEERYILEVY